MNEICKMNCRLFLFFMLSHFGGARSEIELETPLKGVPQKAVTNEQGFLEPSIFYKEYVLKSVPVVMKSALNEFMNGLDVTRLTTNVESFTTYTEVRGKDGVTARNSSIYQMWNTNEDEVGYVDTYIPTSIKSQFHLPKSLQCKTISEGMRSTRLTFSSGERQWDLGINPLHGLLCQLGGESTRHLLDPSSSMSQKDSPLPLSISEYHTAILSEGDCIYIPSGWAHQKNSTGKYFSIILHWTLLSDETKSECVEQTPKDLLTSLFPDDPPLDLVSAIRFNELHHFIREYYLHPYPMDLNTFMNEVTKDIHFDDVTEWDEECKDIAKEMFHQLDCNTDGVLSKEDFRELSKEDLQELVGKLDDRLADFADIVEDAKAERKGSIFTEARKATNGAQDIRKLIEDSFSEIFSDIDTAKRKGYQEDAELDPENEMKRIEKLLKDSIAKEPNTRKDEL